MSVSVFLILIFFLSFSASLLIHPVIFLPFYPTSPFSFFGLISGRAALLNYYHQPALWNHLFLRLSSRVTPLSCIVRWLDTPPQKSSGGILRSIEPIPSGSCGTAPVSGECPSIRPTALILWVCWVSLVSHWTIPGPTNAEQAMTHDATTYSRIQPPPGSVLRPL